VKTNLRGAMWRLGVFAVVCGFGVVSMVMIFGQVRFDSGSRYRAEFVNVTGLKEGNFVRIAGVEVGKVRKVSIVSNSRVLVDFSIDRSVVLTEGSRAAVRWADLIGGRYLALEEGSGGTGRLASGALIPVERSEPALDLDALIGGFRPLFRALDPDQVNALTGQLIHAFQGEGTTIGSFLAQTASVSRTIADRDALIGQVITNLNTVIGTIGGQSTQFAKAIDSLSELVKGLSERKTDIANAVANTGAAAATVADFFAAARPPIQKTVHEIDRAAGIVVADHDYFDDLLNTLPDAYQALARQGIYGDFFSFYLCDLLLKVNGKGGQPVYVKLAGQNSGRCTPR
jgi:phospholipid/cholesterol/gamma-HCH transport system substrate-binding protein